jgi:integrase/recombinase XerD
MRENIPILRGDSKISFREAQSLKDESIWKGLGSTTVEEAIFYWIGTLKSLTAKNYRSGMKKLSDFGLLDPSMSLQAFSLLNHESIVDQIKLFPYWSEATRQSRCACYISFTGFLARRTQSLIKKAIPSKEGTTKTFFKIREKVSTHAMNRNQWIRFLKELELINYRDWLIAQTILQGGKRVEETLSIKMDHVNFEERKIIFFQSKTKGTAKELVITYPEKFMTLLKDHSQRRNSGYLFQTRTGKKVGAKQVQITFRKAGLMAAIPFKTTPHVLRASVVTYLKIQGFSDSDIMKITGHASAEMVWAYDKTKQSDNISSTVELI